jgi:hypothetical protein
MVPDVDKLPDYKYKPLTGANTLRLLRLRPANDANLDIDCELVEFGLPNYNHGAGVAIQNGLAKKRKDDIGLNQDLSYEAVSWCWGKEMPDQLLRVHDNDQVYAFYISQNLKSALWALRKHNVVRQLWIDAICIDQKNTEERNEQVPKMNRIYGNAKSVCIWLGEADDSSKMAMDFIKNQVLVLWEFDKLIENRNMSTQWAALITLMKRPWFSRRWVVQEIALSPSGGTLYCGKDNVPWQDFADAVSLFVEVESATHRLSDVMRRDQLYDHIPDFFGDVPSLGAALLVDATSNLFRNSMTGERLPLSTLEYLVSRLSVFEATQPRDTIYALLAISKETTPRSIEVTAGIELAERLVKAFTATQKLASQSYNVDYKLPVIDVYKEFIEFSIHKSEKTRALDIICRPWAPTVLKSHDKPTFLAELSGKDTGHDDEADEEVALPSWIPGLSGAAFEMEEHPTAGLRMERQNADALVGMPGSEQKIYSAAGTRPLDYEKLRFIKWTSLKEEDKHYPDYSMFVEGFILDEVSHVDQIASNGNMPFQWLKPGKWTDTNKAPPEEFWRTLVADRGTNGRNPPTYFPRACRESMKFKAKTKANPRGNLDTKRLINEGRCTIVAEFLRRVQAVIWNRHLITTKAGRLGLVRDEVKEGYKICILYGCSVPVILKEIKKTDDEIRDEKRAEWLQTREKQVVFLQSWWRAERRQKVQPENPEHAKMHKSAREGLELLHPRKSGTWPYKTNEVDNLDTTPLDIVTSSSIGSSPEDEPLNTDRILRDEAVALTDPPSLESPLLHPARTQVQTSFQEETTNGNGVMGTPPEAKGSWDEDRTGTHEKTGDPKPVQPLTEEEKAAKLAELKERGKREAEESEAQVPKSIKVPEKYYQLFGECYVHGIMNGESFAEQNSKLGTKEMETQTFELR